jgi:hypothetical protein
MYLPYRSDQEAEAREVMAEVFELVLPRDPAKERPRHPRTQAKGLADALCFVGRVLPTASGAGFHGSFQIAPRSPTNATAFSKVTARSKFL